MTCLTHVITLLCLLSTNYLISKFNKNKRKIQINSNKIPKNSEIVIIYFLNFRWPNHHLLLLWFPHTIDILWNKGNNLSMLCRLIFKVLDIRHEVYMYGELGKKLSRHLIEISLCYSHVEHLRNWPLSKAGEPNSCSKWIKIQI